MSEEQNFSLRRSLDFLLDFRNCSNAAQKYSSLDVRATFTAGKAADTLKTPSMVECYRLTIERLVRDHRATNPRVLATVLDEAEQGSAVLRLLVDPLPGATLFDLGELQELLAEALGISVHLLTPGELPERIRERALAKAQPL